jgi:uncharacterized protein YggU (UPF0235/DUF167 family)
VPKAAVTLISGATSRAKRVRVAGVDAVQVRQALSDQQR